MEKRVLDPSSHGQSKKILRSFSLPHVDLRRLKLVKVDSNISEDSSSGYKDSGVEAGDSYPSDGVIGQDYPTNDSQEPEESAQESGKNLSILSYLIINNTFVTFLLTTFVHSTAAISPKALIPLLYPASNGVSDSLAPIWGGLRGPPSEIKEGVISDSMLLYSICYLVY